MTYKADLQLAFSGKEIALERIAIIESIDLKNETAERFSRERREKYEKLLKQSEGRILDIKRSIAEDSSAKRLQLEHYKGEVAQASDRCQIGEISYEEYEKIKRDIHDKLADVKAEIHALQQLYETATSSEIGGQIPIDIDNDVNDYGNIIRESGMYRSAPSSEFDVSDDVSHTTSSVKQHDGISIRDMVFNRGNIIFFGGIIGCVISFFLPYYRVSPPYLGKETITLLDVFFMGFRGASEFDFMTVNLSPQLEYGCYIFLICVLLIIIGWIYSVLNILKMFWKMHRSAK
ncbi:MAG: hypothetical protein LBV40_00055 [Methanomicrobiales archaeon]|nr:hypothetical protein [Methanomicrobiales archaeon]